MDAFFRRFWLLLLAAAVGCSGREEGSNTPDPMRPPPDELSKAAAPGTVLPRPITLFSPDGRRLALLQWNKPTPGGELAVLDVATEKELFRLRLDHWVLGVAFTRDASHIATVGGAGAASKLTLWDGADGRELFTLREEGEIVYVSFAPDAKQLATVTRLRDAYDIRLRDIATGQSARLARRPNLGGLAFHPNGRLLEWTSGRASDPFTGEVLLELRSPQPLTLFGVEFRPDGKRVATAHVPTQQDPGPARVWDAVTGEELFALVGHAGQVTCIAFSPDGSRLATGSVDRTVKLWDAATGQELRTLRGHPAAVMHVMFSADGKRLASVSVDGTLKVWEN